MSELRGALHTYTSFHVGDDVNFLLLLFQSLLLFHRTYFSCTPCRYTAYTLIRLLFWLDRAVQMREKNATSMRECAYVCECVGMSKIVLERITRVTTIAIEWVEGDTKK